MLDRPKITFVMTAYNAEKFVEKAICSVVNQTEKNIRLIIRNNGSTDGTGSICREWAVRDDRITVMENAENWKLTEGGGVEQLSWWNLSLENTGDYVSIIDADDWLSPQFAESLYPVAEQVKADILVAGSSFVNHDGDSIVGSRVPPNLITRDIQDIGPHFIELYNSIRTWWGKLFKREFFIKHYASSWTMSPPLYAPLDTVVMLNYLRNCQVLTTVSYPHYYFRMSRNGTYQNRIMDRQRIYEADELFRAGTHLLDACKINSNRNLEFLYSLNWAYLQEALPGIKQNDWQSPLEKLGQIEAVLNSQTVKLYADKNQETIWRGVEPYIEYILDQDKDNRLVWSSFVIRLYAVRKMLGEGKSNGLTFMLWLSCLSDPKNHLRYGSSLAHHWSSPVVRSKMTKGMLTFFQFGDREKEQVYDSCAIWVYKFLMEDKDEHYDLLLSELRTNVENHKYERACDLLEVMSTSYPTSVDVFEIRIYLTFMLGENVWANHLAHSARVIWPNNPLIQPICADVIFG
ncbi:glycosyltransferase family 2 protein [Gorillibacterium sp. CAU 1737]|uniref:glycosyltransferase family 2 protein n=1 Tax=Gorillibacterium sp. CAU 1737 TaxID=3140362 RepID=UPI0032605A12